MSKLVLVRHGESTWNLENRFTGWVDVDLTEVGLQQAAQAGRLLKEAGLHFDVAYTSILNRAIRTLWQIQDQMNLMWIPVTHSWRLNERHYGALSGLNKAQTVTQYGEAQVLQWRRAYAIAPPPLTQEAARAMCADLRYAQLNAQDIPLTECLQDTVVRVLPFWFASIEPALREGNNVLVVAHGNSIRALVKHLEAISDEDIIHLNIANGVPLFYQFDVTSHRIERATIPI